MLDGTPLGILGRGSRHHYKSARTAGEQESAAPAGSAPVLAQLRHGREQPIHGDAYGR